MTTISDIQSAVIALQKTENWRHLSGWAELSVQMDKTAAIRGLLKSVVSYCRERELGDKPLVDLYSIIEANDAPPWRL